MYRPIEVLLADDYPIFRNGFKLVFKKTTEIKLTGEAENGEELIKMAHQLKPDVIFMDIKMPVLDGIQATRQLQEELPYIHVIALTMFDEEVKLIEMLQAGAKGYLLKNAGASEIIAATKSVFNGENYYCESIRKKNGKVLQNARFINEEKNIPVKFTLKQLTIIGLICQEFSTKQIACKMKIPIRTIEWYTAQIRAKTGTKTASGIVAYAHKNRLFS